MKLRLHGDNLRLRMSQSEVAQLGDAGRLEETVAFAGRSLTYGIAIGEAAISARFDGDRIEIAVPEAIARPWITSNQTGMQNLNSSPKILIEKDFKCLHGDVEEEADSFPNPLSSAH